jgi:hypothetical protein
LGRKQRRLLGVDEFGRSLPQIFFFYFFQKIWEVRHCQRLLFFFLGRGGFLRALVQAPLLSLSASLFLKFCSALDPPFGLCGGGKILCFIFSLFFAEAERDGATPFLFIFFFSFSFFFYIFTPHEEEGVAGSEPEGAPFAGEDFAEPAFFLTRFWKKELSISELAFCELGREKREARGRVFVSAKTHAAIQEEKRSGGSTGGGRMEGKV